MPRAKKEETNGKNPIEAIKEAFSPENDPKPEQDTIKPEYELVGAITADYDKLADALAPAIADRFLARLSAGVRREIIAKSQNNSFSDDCIDAINNGSMNGIRSISGV
ncbi:MAG: hypothetical protein SAJ12_23575 [Jaaginema sp. PMC 1079.18]|nr:hypothetical protein [Jaaginema sp. PMC 1080.18]MEC4853973.1 hypothetical protein [Jaaginema sp. PMC 1079.18]MEC4868893.1 hypothetical protein [Jaaginema sp. PMC 1078.18]